METEKLARLRATLAKASLPENHLGVPLGHAEADAALMGGLKRGALHEVFAQSGHEAAATGFAAGLAARVSGGKHIFWIRQDFSALEFGELAATGFLEFGIAPSRLLLFRSSNAEDAMRAALDALSCAALGAVVIEIAGEPKILDLVATRRLTLAAAEKNVAAILLRFNAAPDASTAQTRWLVRAVPSQKNENWGHPGFETELVRNRHGRTGHWVMMWSCDDGHFRPADRGAVVSAPFDRPAATQMAGALRSVA